jgi:four helix bundle protein
MHYFNFENLDVFTLSVAVNRWFAETPFPTGRAHLKDQGLRASDSLVLNIAEGVSRQGVKAGRNHLRIAQGSAGECAAVLHCLRLPNSDTQLNNLRRIDQMLKKMIR